MTYPARTLESSYPSTYNSNTAPVAAPFNASDSPMVERVMPASKVTFLPQLHGAEHGAGSPLRDPA